jgi:phenylacetate-CoA ligase
MMTMAYRDLLLKGYYACRCWVPARCLYHPDYFRVRRLLAADPGRLRVAAAMRLRHVLRTAVLHVPFYRRTVKLSPAELANEAPAELLHRFPYLSKDQVMACQNDFVDERADLRRLHYATSGGSSGQGIGLWRSKRLADIEKAFFNHEWAQFGFSFDKARTLRIGADARRLAHQAPARAVGNRLMLSPYHLAPPHRAAIVDALWRFRPHYLHAYPSSAADLVDLLAPSGLRLPVRAVLLASEPATRQQLASIAAFFDCPVSICYGLTERTNLAFAGHRLGITSPYRFEPLYAVNENRLIGGRAEIVGTSLWNDLMPLIRYCSDDFGVIDAGGVCAAIDGRAQEFLLDRHGNRIPGLSIVIDERTWDFVRLYQVRQRSPGAITLCVVARHGRLSAQERQFVLDAQVRRWGGWFDVGIDEVADIPRSPNGKRKLVVSEIGAA